MKVKTVRKHRNTHGDQFEKPKGYEYEHPSPAADIAAGFVKEIKAEPKAPK